MQLKIKTNKETTSYKEKGPPGPHQVALQIFVPPGHITPLGSDSPDAYFPKVRLAENCVLKEFLTTQSVDTVEVQLILMK